VLGKRKFAQANPDHDPKLPCVYVGRTGLTPEERFAKHRSGRKACPFVRDYGERLVPELFAHLNPMSFDEADAREVQLAEELRASGYAVWQK